MHLADHDPGVVSAHHFECRNGRYGYPTTVGECEELTLRQSVSELTLCMPVFIRPLEVSNHGCFDLPEDVVLSA